MIDLSKAKGESWNPIGSKETKHLDLFNTEELKRAEPIAKALEGMAVSSAKELLSKVSKAIDQLAIL